MRETSLSPGSETEKDSLGGLAVIRQLAESTDRLEQLDSSIGLETTAETQGNALFFRMTKGLKNPPDKLRQIIGRISPIRPFQNV